jgi:MtN3 and saliva related transmembrane protein
MICWYAALVGARAEESSLVITLIGYLAALFTTISAVPQLIRTLRTRDARGISIRSWLTLALGVALWLVYGICVGSGPLICANAVSLGLELTIIAVAAHARLNSAV